MRKVKGILTVAHEIDVQFYDVDAMRVVWHGNYVKYIEDARCQLLRKFNYDYNDMEDSGYVWPIVDMRLKYVKSAEFGNKIRVEATLVEYETRLKISYRIFNVETNQILTKAYTVQVAVNIESNEMQFESPAILLEKLAPFLTDVSQ
jgi:acyl-CoA thioester hydrolase